MILILSLQVHYIGINALDINAIDGKSDLYSKVKLPHGFGLEALVVVVKIGTNCLRIMNNLQLREGSPALYIGKKAYTEYLYLDNVTLKHTCLLFPIPSLKPHYLAFGISGLTATIGLDKVI